MLILPRVLHRHLLNTAVRSVRVRAPVETRCMCTAKEDLDKPVKFSTSKASTWKAEYSRRGEEKEEKELWYELPVVLASTIAFLTYFCALREENDIDDTFKVPIYDRIEGLEEVQLRQSLEFNLARGLPVAEIQERLATIEKDKAVG